MLRNMLVTIVFAAAILVGVWDLLQIEAFDNAIVQFATAGVVPGTGVTLSPGQVYLSLCALLLIVICLLFRKALARDFRDFRASFKPAAPQLEVPTQATMLPAAPAAALYAPQVPTREDTPAVALEPRTQDAPGLRPAVVITIPGAPGYLPRAYRAFVAWYRPARARLWRYTVTRSRQDARQLWAYTLTADRSARAYAVRAWRYAEPRIREYDARIERAVKHNAKAALLLREADQFATAVQRHIDGWRAKSQHPVEK